MNKIDFSINFENTIFIIELKVEDIGKKAIEQIKERKYEEKYLSKFKSIFLIGLNFSKKKKNLESWDVEKIFSNK